MPPKHETPTPRDRQIVEEIDGILDRLCRNVHVENERDAIADAIEHILGEGGSGSALHSKLVDLYMARLTWDGRTMPGLAITGRALEGEETLAAGTIHGALERAMREPNPREKRRIAVAVKAAWDIIGPPIHPGQGEPIDFPVPAALLRAVHQDLHAVWVNAKRAQRVPADVWHCGVDAKTEPAEACWRLLAWRLGYTPPAEKLEDESYDPRDYTGWRTVRSHAQQDSLF